MKVYGLIGRSLSHSFSQSYFLTKFAELGLTDHVYRNFELQEISQLREVLDTHGLCGLNVTIPYKSDIIPYLNEIDETAKLIGAVNCVKINNGLLKGFNTDAYGFSQSIKPFLDSNHERALILGTGGAAKAVSYALKQIGVEVFFVSSSAQRSNSTLHYEDINETVMQAFKLIVNTTPLGTQPKLNECPPLPYHLVTPNHFLYDLIYNPTETLFLKNGKERGATTMNGLSMLQLQAEKSWEIWQQN